MPGRLLSRKRTADLTNEPRNQTDTGGAAGLGLFNVEAMAAIRDRFEEQAPQDLAAALGPLEHALEHLGEEAAQQGRALSSKADELEQWTQGAQPLLEAIQAAIEAAAQVE